MDDVLCELDEVVLPLRVKASPCSLTVERGQVWLLDGPAGSGKTTLLRLMTGLIRPAAGRIRLFGEDPHSLPVVRLATLRQRLGVLLERDGLVPSWSVVENLALHLRYRGVDDEQLLAQRIRGVLARTGESEEVLERRVDALTERQRRRIALARLLMQDAELILIDELPLYAGALDASPADIGALLFRHDRAVVAVAPAAWCEQLGHRSVQTVQLNDDGRIVVGRCYGVAGGAR